MCEDKSAGLIQQELILSVSVQFVSEIFCAPSKGGSRKSVGIVIRLSNKNHLNRSLRDNDRGY